MNLVVEPGKIELMVGSSSEDIRLCDMLEITGTQAVPVKERLYLCPTSIA